MALPLAGIRVISLAHQYPGPFATMLLSDLGADVVLIEHPHGGDPTRRFPAFHASLARGKRSIAVDLKTAAGRDALDAVLAGADVLLDGYRPGTLARLGFGHDELGVRHPHLVYVSVSGFGQSGPYADRPGHDLTYQAEAGMLYEHTPPAPPPAPPALAFGDLVAGLFAAQAVLVGLLRRQREDTGSYVDVAMVDGLLSVLTAHVVPVVNELGQPGFPYEPGYGVYRTSDGAHLALGVAHEDHFWRSLCDVTGLIAERDLSAEQRHTEHSRLRHTLAEALRTRTAEEWERLLGKADVPVGRLRSLAETAESPHIVARELFTPVTESDGEQRSYVRQPLVVDGSAPGPRSGVPRLGEHTHEVLAEAGLSPDGIREVMRCEEATT